MAEDCSHINTLERDGYYLCSDCGLILDDCVYSNDVKFEDYDSYQEFSKENSDSILYEMLERNMISKQVLDLAEIFLKKWGKDDRPKKSLHTVFSIYCASRQLDYPITLKELCDFFQVSIKKISEMESIFGFRKMNNVFTYIEKYCGILGINFKDQKIIRSKCELFEKKKSIQPIILLACVIYIFGKGKWTYKDLANIFNVCEQSVKKWVKYFNQHY